jgi:hypothetical protein
MTASASEPPPKPRGTIEPRVQTVQSPSSAYAEACLGSRSQVGCGRGDGYSPMTMKTVELRLPAAPTADHWSIRIGDYGVLGV